MLGKINQVSRNKVKAMVIRTRTSVQELPALLGESYGKIMTLMNSNGAMPAGAPYVVYFNQDMTDMEIEIGIPTAMYIQDTDEIVLSEIPEGRYVSAIYTGPYSGLEAAYGEMAEYMKANGLEVKDAVYESYLNDPADTPEDKLMTEILFGLK